MQKLYTQRNKINEPCSCADKGTFAGMAQNVLTALARKPDDAQESPKGNAQSTPAKSGRYAGMFTGGAA